MEKVIVSKPRPEKNIIINFFTLIACVFFVVYSAYYFFQKDYFFAYFYLVILLGIIITLVISKRLKNETLARYILAALGLPVLIPWQINGGTGGAGIFWYYPYIVWIFFLLGKSRGLWWVCVIFLISIAEFILQLFAYLPFPYSVDGMLSFYFGFILESAIMLVYQTAKEKAEINLRQQTNQLEIAKRALEQAKAEDEAILASLGEGMITMGTSGYIFLVNNAALKMLNLQEQDIVGKSINDIFLLKDAKGNIVKPEKNIKGEYIVVRSDKSEFPISLITTPIVLNEQTIGVIQLFRDITEEKRLDQAKSEFVALASHQLRTPISAISWFSEMLLHGDAGDINKEQRGHLTQIYQSNQRMAALVDALLNVSRLEMGNFSVTPVSTNLASFCHKILTEELGKQEPQKKFVIKENYDPQIGSFSIDQDLMKIILQNLFTNSIKYTPENGSISISISPSGQKAKDSANNKDEGILIVVSDTGYGIPKNQQDKVFTKLFRADNVKVKDTDGTGLGLYIVKSIVEAVGGKIWLESEENKGTTFYVFFPKEGMKAQKGEKKLAPAKNE